MAPLGTVLRDLQRNHESITAAKARAPLTLGHEANQMCAIQSTLQAYARLRARFGTIRTIKHAAFRLVNRCFYLDCLCIIALDRESLKPLDPKKASRLSARIATVDDLQRMQEQGCWEINHTKIDCFHQGDACLLSYVDSELAGYTWVHTEGHPELVPGLKVSTPREYLYNFAAFTHPSYRGCGLQSFRHHELLNHDRWKEKKGLLGFVVNTNYSSQRGQDKSGYRRIGNIWLMGKKDRFHAHIGRGLRRMGIRRIPC